MNPTRLPRSFRGLLSLAIGLLAALVLVGASPPKKSLSVDLSGGVQMEFVLIPAGSFLMGSEENMGDGDESPVHRVTITQPFYFGACEVTQEQWEKIMGANPSGFQGAKLPVETVSWHDCQRFLARLGAKTGRKFALPTEAQWEYACRAGTAAPWNFGGSESLVKDHAWMGENSEGATHPVGTKTPNAWGLHDLHGNVGEWCADWYAKHAYAAGEIKDPRGPATGESRVVRGGGWGEDADHVRCAVRNCNGPDGATRGTGLRCVLLVDEP